MGFKNISDWSSKKKQSWNSSTTITRKKKEVHSSIHAFNSYKTLVSYVPSKKKAVILLSTRHHSTSIDKENENKLEIIKFYDDNKGFK